MTIEVGKRYKFKGFAEKDGHVDVAEVAPSGLHWAKLTRAGHAYNNKLLPFDKNGKYIGSLRWWVPDLECEIKIETEDVESDFGGTTEVESDFNG